MNIPEHLKYTKDHEWLNEENGTATIGITEHAQGQLGDIVFVDLPKVGSTLSLGKTFGTVESVKAVSDLFAPASGEVTEVNAVLTHQPELLNSDPYGNAWLVKIKVTHPSELSTLLSADAYRAFL